MSVKDTVQIGLLGVAGFLLYKFYGQAKTLAQPVASVIADFYTWIALPPAMTVQGNVILPGGTSVPLSLFDVRESADGQVYAQYQGHFYQLYPHDDNGDWPSVLVQ